METQKFKRGDRVMSFTHPGSKMKVLDYLVDTHQVDHWNYYESKFWNGDLLVECMWEDELGAPQLGVFKDDDLAKIEEGMMRGITNRVGSSPTNGLGLH